MTRHVTEVAWFAQYSVCCRFSAGRAGQSDCGSSLRDAILVSQLWAKN